MKLLRIAAVGVMLAIKAGEAAAGIDLPSATVGFFYSQQLFATCNGARVAGKFDWPAETIPGLTFTTSGLISGVPTVAGHYDVLGTVEAPGTACSPGWNFAYVILTVLPATLSVVEYYNESLDHYFVTWVSDEIAKLDAGTEIKGWKRTGVVFKSFVPGLSGTTDICRIYIIPVRGDSHF